MHKKYLRQCVPLKPYLMLLYITILHIVQSDINKNLIKAYNMKSYDVLPKSLKNDISCIFKENIIFTLKFTKYVFKIQGWVKVGIQL